jgi:hypothetical protein
MLHFFLRIFRASEHTGEKRNILQTKAAPVMDHRQLLRGDCASCQGLCCASLPFDRSESFGFDKPADVPCRYLQPSNGCGIHDWLVASGFAGCASYDCFGAGQRVTRELFPGAVWRSSPQLARAMFAAFRQLKHVHELRLLLHEAAVLDLEPRDAQRCRSLLMRLEPEPRFTTPYTHSCAASVVM